MWLMKNARGKPDAALTAAMLGTYVVLFRVLVSGVHLVYAIKGVPIDLSFTPLDGAIITAILGPLWAAYWARKHTDAGGFGAKVSPKSDDPSPPAS